MSFLEALILGLTQALTEFFPVSSSTHLELVRKFLNLEGQFQYFDLICHGGTMAALCFYLRREILEILKTPRLTAIFFVALLPLIPVYFLAKSYLAFFRDPYYLGCGLLSSAFLLYLASRCKEKEEKKFSFPMADSRLKWTDVLCIGVMQTFAFLPGISRSASTIAAARFRGLSWVDGARFSFLLAIPAILGGECLEMVRLMKSDVTEFLSWDLYMVGFLSSFLVGLLTVRGMFWIYERAKITPFVVYCAILGLFILRIFHA